MIPVEQPSEWEAMVDRYLTDPKLWDAIVEDYVAVGEHITTPYCLDALDGLDPRLGARLLDVATGTGALAMAAARRGAGVLAADSSPAMVAYLAARAASAGLANLDARVMDGQALDLPDASFDLACSVFGVMLFLDHRAGLSEIRRVLVPGGSAAVVAWSDPDRIAHLKIWWDAIRDAFPDSDDFDRPAGWRAMETPEGLAGELERCGFREVQVRPLRHEWAVPSADWLVAQNTDHNPLYGRLYERLGPGSGERVRGRMLARLKEEHGDSPFALPAEAWLAIGRR
jgi:ubiquinone/menaquinone biosynthesis C-methylase UbiE